MRRFFLPMPSVRAFVPLLMVALCACRPDQFDVTPAPPLPLASAGPSPGATNPALPTPKPSPTGSPDSPKRGFSAAGPWLAYNGSSVKMGDVEGVKRAVGTYRIMIIDADPGAQNFTASDIKTLQGGGQNKVLSVLELGTALTTRTYWTKTDGRTVPLEKNPGGQLGPVAGRRDAVWLNTGDTANQQLIMNYVAPQLAAQGVDGFCLDGLELLEHLSGAEDGPCSQVCRQGGLELVAQLRKAFPDMLLVVRNATGDVLRFGTAGNRSLPTLLDGICRQSGADASPGADERKAQTDQELLDWQNMGLTPGGKPFWIGVAEEVADCSGDNAAHETYARIRAKGFSPTSVPKNGACFWGF